MPKYFKRAEQLSGETRPEQLNFFKVELLGDDLSAHHRREMPAGGLRST
jgi:hypothetical protein